ncbi:hypothetical protein ATN84_23285 [Paramesorhizobium deserti]|uniref:DUF3313 domain-containing protein n=1 Tax=Paramesorhizobium deserti TaxID=1494590 RepID=A0A135HYC7_9HYPH|nr:hypothetical protein ATN84_23285 [Paramesorhizobium deserti]
MHLVWPLALMMGGCANVPLDQANTLASYDGLTSNNGKMTKAKYKVAPADLASLKTIYIEPVAISPAAARSVKKSSDQGLVANALGRALCVGVSDRYTVVDSPENADITVHATVTNIVPTNATVAGVSAATSFGAGFATSVPVPRIPIGLGGLAVEAEATSRDGRQLGAMVWAKGAKFIGDDARASQVGDAYSLASKFGDDFSKMLVKGKSPFKGFPVSLPSGQKLKSNLGGKPKYAACEAFGRSPGLIDMAASQVGAPPSWTDKRRPVQGK